MNENFVAIKHDLSNLKAIFSSLMFVCSMILLFFLQILWHNTLIVIYKHCGIDGSCNGFLLMIEQTIKYNYFMLVNWKLFPGRLLTFQTLNYIPPSKSQPYFWLFEESYFGLSAQTVKVVSHFFFFFCMTDLNTKCQVLESSFLKNKQIYQKILIYFIKFFSVLLAGLLKQVLS